MRPNATGPLFGIPVIFWTLIIATSLVYLWPFAIYHIAGDVKFHYFNLECFGRAMLEGEVYPRWCSYVNHGYGSPAMFFYFPLPYIISLPFYPITHSWITTEQLYVLQLIIINMVTLAGCLMWFRKHVSLKAGFVLGLLYLWFPYRMEVLFYRSAFGELWLMALIPWVMWSIEKLKENQKLWPLVSIFMAMCILCHIPSAIVLFTALAVMVFTGLIPVRCVKALCLAIAGAILLTAIYWLPALIYKPFVLGNAEINLMDMFPNRQPLPMDFAKPQRIRVLINAGSTFLILLAISSFLFSKSIFRDRLSYSRSLNTAIALILLTAFIFLPISAPLWNWLKLHLPMAEMIMPWRFQSLLLIAAMLLGLLLIDAHHKKILVRRTWRNDLLAYFVLLFFQSLFTFVSFIDKPPQANYDEYLKQAIVPLKEYRTIWQPKTLGSADDVVKTLSESKTQYKILEGKAEIHDYRLTHNRIDIEIEAKTYTKLMLHYYYFPSWKIITSDLVTLRPQKDGFMELSIPSGSHHIILEQNAYNSYQAPYLSYLPWATLCLWASVIALVWQRLKRK